MQSSQNVIAKLWDFICVSRPFYFLTQSLSLHILDMWHEKGRSYGIGAVWWEAVLGAKARLQFQAVSRKRSNSKSSKCCSTSRVWVSDATSWWDHQLCLALGHGMALGMSQLSDVYSLRSDRSSPPVRWCCFILQRSILHPLLSAFIYSSIHLCICWLWLQWNQSWKLISHLKDSNENS